MVRNTNESIPLDLVPGIAVSKRLWTSSIKTQSAQAMEGIKNVDKADADSFAEALRGLLSHRTHAVMGHQVPASADKEDPVTKIKRLKELLDLGAISSEEDESNKTEPMKRL